MSLENLIEDPKKILNGDEKLTISRLGIKHIFKFINILKKGGVVNKFFTIIQDLQKDSVETEEERRAQALQAAVEMIFSLSEAESEIYDFIGALIGKDEKFASELPLEVLPEIIANIIDSSDLKAFFKSVQKFLPTKLAETSAPMENN